MALIGHGLAIKGSEFSLPAQQVRHSSVRAGEPKQTEYPDDKYLAYNRKAINQKGTQTARNGRFN